MIADVVRLPKLRREPVSAEVIEEPTGQGFVAGQVMRPPGEGSPFTDVGVVWIRSQSATG